MKMNRYFMSLGLLLAVTGASVAQSQLEFDPVNYPVKFLNEEAAGNFSSALGKKAVESGWLTPAQLNEDYGATFTGSSFFPLFQDSSVFFVPSTQATSQEPYSNAWNLFGTVFQPNDPLYELQTTGWGFTRFTNYSCDSVAFPYAYIRQVDQIDVGGNMVDVVDTAFIHYYQNNNLNTGWFFNNSDEIFSLPIANNFDRQKLGPRDVLFVDTMLLTADAATDSTLEETISIGSLRSAIANNVKNVAADNQNMEDNVIGVSISFKTGLPYSFGDTLLSYNDQIVPDKKMNVFGTVAYYNTGSRVIQTEYNNNSFVTNRQVLYGQSIGSLKGYLPCLSSTGWQRDFYCGASFHVTGNNVGVKDTKDLIGLQVYPNPVTKGNNIIVTASKNKSSKVTLNVFDLVGNSVYSANQNAADFYSIPTSHMLPGIYFVTMTVDGAKATQKVVITE